MVWRWKNNHPLRSAPTHCLISDTCFAIILLSQTFGCIWLTMFVHCMGSHCITDPYPRLTNHNLFNATTSTPSIASSVSTRTTTTTAFWGYPHLLIITHTIDSYWIPSQTKTKSNLQIYRICQISNVWIKTNYTRQTCCSCLITCVNMKWIRRVFLKMESGYHSVHSRTDGQTSKVKPV